MVEAKARLEKAIQIVDLIDAAGITSEQVAGFQPEHWHQAATAARVNPPSQQTQDRVLRMLRSREAARELLRSNHVQPQHPPDEEERDCRDHDVTYPLPGRPGFSSVLHGTECIRLGQCRS
jgi:hypothetical protein